jgi:restriction endonuclease S subunit
MGNGEKYIALGSCSSIRTGQTFKNSLHHNDQGDLSVLLPRDISSGQIISTPIKIHSSEVSTLHHHILKRGEILIANKGSKFGTFIYEGQPTLAIATASFFVISPDRQILPQYLYWYLNQPPAKEYFTQHASGSTVPSITKPILSDLAIPLISIQEQQYIIQFIQEAAFEQKLLEKLLQRREQFCNSYIWERIIKYNHERAN